MAIAFNNTAKKYGVLRGTNAVGWVNTSASSMTMWFKINTLPTSDQFLLQLIEASYAAGGGTNEGSYGVYFDASAGKLVATSTASDGTNEEVTLDATITAGQWYLLSCRRAGNGTLTAYLGNEGTSQATTSSASSPDVAMVEMVIGRGFDGSGSPTTASMDVSIGRIDAWNILVTNGATNGLEASPSRTPDVSSTTPICSFDLQNDVADSVGNGTLESLAKFDFEDDSDLFGTYTGPAEVPASLIRSDAANALTNNSNWLIDEIGDSFASDRSAARITLPLINELGNVPAGLIAGARTDTGTHPLLVTVSASGTGVTPTEVSNSNAYDIEGDGIGTPGHYAMPESMQQVTMDAAASLGTQLFRCWVQNPSNFTSTPLNDFVTMAEGFLVQLTYKATTDAANTHTAVVLRDGGDSAGDTTESYSPSNGACFKSTEKFVNDAGNGANQSLWVRRSGDATDAANRSKVNTLAAMRWLRTSDGSTPDNGLIWRTCSNGSSRSYANYGVNTSSTGAGSGLKDFSDAEYISRTEADFAGLLDRQMLIVVHFATEADGYADAKADMEAIITRMDARYAAITGAPQPKYLFIMPGVHAVGSPDLVSDRLQAERYSEAAYDVASANTRVSYYSHYHATDGGAFYDTSDLPYGAAATTDPQRVWLTGYDADNGTTYDSTTSGILRDTDSLHLKDATAAAFEVEILTAALQAAAGGALLPRLNSVNALREHRDPRQVHA